MTIRKSLATWAGVLVACAALSACLFQWWITRKILPWHGEQPVRATHGMVVSVHHLASDAGVEILRQGGNAVDAAVATAFALAVVHPIGGNIGGGGFMLLRAHDGRATFINFREKAPLAATETMFQDAKGNVIPGASLTGYRAIATPGSVAGLAYAERKYGKLGLVRVMAPAIRLASEGFQISYEEASDLADPRLAEFADSRRVFQRDGHFYRTGDTFRQPELARTLQRVAADPDDFYHGKMAQELVDELHKGGALLTLEDFARYDVVELQPIVGSFHDYTILTSPPPSSGGVTLLSALNILEGYDLSKLGDRTPASMHLIVEAFRRAYMDRAEYLGDPDYNRIPVDNLISKAYAAAWRAGIAADAATPSAALRRPEGFLPAAPATAGQRIESPDTTHFSVVDREGNAVSVTTTLNNDFGSAVTAGTLGFLLNDEMDDFDAKTGIPNRFGMIQGPANAIAPGKRPLSSMTPTIVLQHGELRFVLGSPGGARVASTVGNIFLSVTQSGLNIQEAVDAPRFHHQYRPDRLDLEPGFSAATRRALRARGYALNESRHHWSDGECIAIDPKTGELLGGHDHRSRYGKAVGY
ncbi:MAG TPA: gamma-glutamyltransferase [Terracidiphilus sp.]|jgi:gamma-glutamyltranspeptidase/glutathione hydrolase|nr:gamma-glutamyltransferase [Terracidiphilus sp.]